MKIQSILQHPLPYQQKNITATLIGVNVVVFFLTSFNASLLRYLAMSPVLVIKAGFWWQLVTYMFAHANIRHLLFNMLALFFFGTQVEHRIGSYEFLLFYILTGFLAGIFSLLIYWFTGSSNVFLLGASGAVYAVLFAFAAYFPNAQIFVFGILPVRAAVLVMIYTGIEILSQISGRGGNIAHLTHLAGFGFAYLYFLIRMGINPIRRFFD